MNPLISFFVPSVFVPSVFIPSVLIPGLLLPVAAFAAEVPASGSSDLAQVAQDNNAFAIELYGQLRHQSGNLFFSPESISAVLAMTYAGARGDTAAEMAKILHFTLPPERLHSAMGALLRDRNAAHDGYQSKEADALWVQTGYALLPEFLKLNEDSYSAGLKQLDFKSATEASRQTINQWVEQQTGNKIRELLQPGNVNSDTRLVLTNAIYFNANWAMPFKKENTKDEDFRVSATQTIKTPLMHMSKSFKYCDGGSFQALEIPYWQSNLSMIVLLPKDTDGLSALERSLTPFTIRQILPRLSPAATVALTLPKFTMEVQFKLADMLTAMGMKEAFDWKKANFSGIASRETMQRDGNLFIGAVIHKADVDVNEEGTEAAAATGIAVRGAALRSPPPIIFRSDHPFMFLIRDNRSGSILFLGRVTDPSK
jgi:serpin B